MAHQTLPGLIDVHTHLRVPGGEHKEDFSSGTAAALAGGFTTILAMPNTTPPITTRQIMEATHQKAQPAIYCDVGLFAGASREYLDHLPDVAGRAIALKIYLNDTFGTLRVEKLPTLITCFQRWSRSKTIALHAEGQSVAVGIGLAAAYQRHIHFCHISRQPEIELIAAAKKRGLPVSCEVTPHHLFLTQADAGHLGPLGDMRPILATQADVDALWGHINTTIDCIATDHAPHTLTEKQSDNPPPGIAGLETSLPLMLTAVKENRLSMERLIELMFTNPRQIFNLPVQPNTHIEADLDAHYTISNQELQTKCGWTPFDGRQVSGRVQRVVLRGKTAYDFSQPDKPSRILAQPGSGKILF